MIRRLLPAAAVAALALGCDNGFLTQQGYEPAQPIAFSHALHTGQFQINCQYCHFGAGQSRHAGVPPAQLCLGCHSQVKKDAPEIVALTKAVQENRPIEWVRVHRLPDFAWFSHQNHVSAGVECQTCHGPVETMVRIQQVETMTMGWCLDCHRRTLADPEQSRRLQPPTDCAACHH
jgi:cytochrome c7-like protein